MRKDFQDDVSILKYYKCCSKKEEIALGSYPDNGAVKNCTFNHTSLLILLMQVSSHVK